MSLTNYPTIDKSFDGKAHHHVIEVNGYCYLQSYEVIVAAYSPDGTLYLSSVYHDWSRTTSKYVYQFCRMETKARRQYLVENPNRDIMRRFSNEK